MERLDAFMARANAAYYATHDPFRDFTTAPEISQVFGELLGAWASVTWELMDRPAPVILCECGPGRGTLMADALRAIRKVAPAFSAALRLHLVESSPRLRAEQAQRLPSAIWHGEIGTLPAGPMLLLANEFLDALPIRQFVRRGAGWAERHVEAGAFVEIPGPGPARDAAEGDVVELGEAGRTLVAAIARRVVRDGGAALYMDYGPQASAAGESLQAIRDGAPTDPLDRPGSADLTAHVDFASLADTAAWEGAAVHGPVAQGLFLARLGLFQRTDRLASTQTPARAAALIQAAQRLAEPAGMGRLFKAMAVCHPGLPVLPGFAE